MKYFSPGLLDGSVTSAKLADGSVTTVKLAPLAVTNPKIDSDAVATVNLLDLAVTTDKLAANAATTAKIANGAVNQTRIFASVSTMAGSVPGNFHVDIALTRDSYFPMVHVADQDQISVTGHSVDGTSSNNPRLALNNNAGAAVQYDVDTRNVRA